MHKFQNLEALDAICSIFDKHKTQLMIDKWKIRHTQVTQKRGEEIFFSNLRGGLETLQGALAFNTYIEAFGFCPNSAIVSGNTCLRDTLWCD